MLETRGLEPGAVPHFFDWVARALAIYPDTGMGSLLGSISAALTAAFSALLAHALAVKGSRAGWGPAAAGRGGERAAESG